MSRNVKYILQSCALFAGIAGLLVSMPAQAGFDWTPPKEKPQDAAISPLTVTNSPSNGPLTPELDEPVAAPVESVDATALPTVADDGKKVSRMQTIPAKAVERPESEQVAPLAADNINAAPATAPAVLPEGMGTLYEGFGREITLALALREIAPPHYAFSFDRSEYAAQNISWDGGRPWVTVLNDALAQRSLMAVVSGHIVRITAKNGGVNQESSVAPVSQGMTDTPMDITNAPASPTTAQTEPIGTLSDHMVVNMAMKSTWKANPGATLREVLDGWTKGAKVDLQWMTPYDYPINNSFVYEGTFQEAIASILASYSRESHPPRGKLYPNLPTGPSVLMIN